GIEEALFVRRFGGIAGEFFFVLFVECHKRGGDARVFLKRYPGRAATVHLKPFSKTNPDAVIGEDELPWADIFNLCETVGKTEWYIVEYEREAMPPLVGVEKCFRALRKMGKC
ncbi:MAG: hypothetical protein N2689_18050, partial [Verrucomicrobiae bacterium]|nr:hypothetical protein [Verrucomicrobiae bacterium]